MTRLLLLLASLTLAGCDSSPNTGVYYPRPDQPALVYNGREVARVPAPVGRMWKFLTTSPSVTVTAAR